MKELSRPPGRDWIELVDRGGGYLSTYYSDAHARHPVRDITRPRDNKSDPNLETGTYGLFSTCGMRSMRRKLVRDGGSNLFFVTSHGPRRRAITGYYQVGWYAESVFGAERGDLALAARRMRFVEPIPLTSLPGAAGEICVRWFRTCRPLSAETCAELLDIIARRDDLTDAYLAEITRMELRQRERTGFSYPSWRRSEGFTAADGIPYLGTVPQPPGQPGSAKHWWCRRCGETSEVHVCLKACPACKALGTLEPVRAP